MKQRQEQPLGWSSLLPPPLRSIETIRRDLGRMEVQVGLQKADLVKAQDRLERLSNVDQFSPNVRYANATIRTLQAAIARGEEHARSLKLQLARRATKRA